VLEGCHREDVEGTQMASTSGRPWPEQVILVGLRRLGTGQYAEANECFGLRLLASSLSENGFDVALLPSHDSFPDEAFSEIASRIDCCPDGGVIGLSIDSHHLPVALRMASWAKHHAPEWMTAAGGAHFADAEGFADQYLSYFDVVNLGHGTPFVDLLNGLRNGRSTAHQKEGSWLFEGRIPKGLRVRGSDGQTAGFGAGTAPPITGCGCLDFTEGSNSQMIATVLLSEQCSNRCDYCFASRPYVSRSHDLEVKSIAAKAREVSSPIYVDLLDNSPLMDGRKHGGLAFLHELSREIGTGSFSSILYIDAGMLARFPSRLIEFLEKGVVAAVYVGRDIVDEEVAKAVGRRYLGRTRDRAELDSEAEAILDLILWLRESGIALDMSVEYLLTPFETEHSVKKLLDEMTTLSGLSSSAVHVSVEFQIVCPFPGTKMYRDMRGSYLPLEKAPGYVASYWHPRVSEACTFLKLVELLVYPNNRFSLEDPSCDPGRQAALMELASSLALGREHATSSYCNHLEPSLVAMMVDAWSSKKLLEERMLDIYGQKLEHVDGAGPDEVRSEILRQESLLSLHREFFHNTHHQ